MPDPFIKKIQERLQHPLPGQPAQLRMAPASRRKYMTAPEGVRRAAVMATLFPKNEEWHIVFIERNKNDRDSHGGQISFPGGKAEPEDGTMLKTALRETEEEVGIPQQEIKVLGSLSQVYIPVSNFNVYPYVGFLDFQPDYVIQEEEVSKVLEIPVAHFQNEAVIRTTDIPINEYLTLKNVPYYEVDNQVLWGATAMMMSELMEVIGN